MGTCGKINIIIYLGADCGNCTDPNGASDLCCIKIYSAAKDYLGTKEIYESKQSIYSAYDRG